MGLTEESTIDAALALLAVDHGLRQLFEKVVGKLEDANITPATASPTDRDWLALHLSTGNGITRPLATLLLRLRDANRSCPQWVEQICKRWMG